LPAACTAETLAARAAPAAVRKQSRRRIVISYFD
jgi:hypothetical protein